MIMTKKSFNTVLKYFVGYCIMVLVDSIIFLEEEKEDCRSPGIEMLENCCVLIRSWHVLNSTPTQWLIPLTKSLAVQNIPHCEDVQSWKPPGSLSTFFPLRLSSLQTMAMPTGSCIWNLGLAGVDTGLSQGQSGTQGSGWTAPRAPLSPSGCGGCWGRASLQWAESSGVFYGTAGFLTPQGLSSREDSPGQPERKGSASPSRLGNQQNHFCHLLLVRSRPPGPPLLKTGSYTSPSPGMSVRARMDV